MATLTFSIREQPTDNECLTVRGLVRFLRWIDVLYNRLLVLEWHVLGGHEPELPSGPGLKYMIVNSLDSVDSDYRLLVKYISVNDVEISLPRKISIHALDAIAEQLNIIFDLYFENEKIINIYDNYKSFAKQKRVDVLYDFIDYRLDLTTKLKTKKYSSDCIEEVLTRMSLCTDKLFRAMCDIQIHLD